MIPVRSGDTAKRFQSLRLGFSKGFPHKLRYVFSRDQRNVGLVADLGGSKLSQLVPEEVSIIGIELLERVLNAPVDQPEGVNQRFRRPGRRT